MADVLFSDWDALAAAVNKKANNILNKDVAPVAKEILKKHIRKDIYEAYTPKPNGWVITTPGGHWLRTTYKRRYSLEGGVYARLNSPNVLLVTSKATASPSVIKGYSFRNRYDGAFLKLLESGNMGVWRGGFARPAVGNTQKEFDNGNARITSAINKGIKREIEGK